MNKARLLVTVLASQGVTYGDEQTLTLRTTGVTDGYINAAAPTSNFAAGTFILVGEPNDGTGTTRTLVKFTLDDLPADALITGATLSLFNASDKSDNARTFRVFRLKRAWVAAEVTWNIWKTSNNWSTAGAFGADDCEQTEIGSRAMTATEATNEYKDFSLTPTTKAALDLGNGFLIKADTELDDQYRFARTTSATEGQRPKLVITYRVPL